MGADTYVVYRGDDVLCVGTARECAERLGVSEASVRWLATPSSHRKEAARPGRMVAERVVA